MNAERPLIAGAVGGLLHLVLVGGLHVYLHGPELFGYSARTNSFSRVEPTTIYVVFGAFVLGDLPAVLLSERRLVTPALTVLAFVAGIVLLSPRGLEPDWEAAGASNLDFYFHLWFVPVVVASLLGGIEALVQHLLAEGEPADGSSVGD